MDKKVTRKIGSFNAATDNGKIISIIIYQDFHIIRSLNKSSQEIPGLKFFETASGQAVNMINENTYEIIGAPESITVKKI